MQEQDPPAGNRQVAYLEHQPELNGPLQRIAIDPLPFEMGRGDAADYTIYSPRVSKRHAAIVWDNGIFRVRDLGSTNGTFVNGKRVGEAVLRHGDILHLADKEFLFHWQEQGTVSKARETMETRAAKVEPQSLIRGVQFLREMLSQHFVSAHFQPIVGLQTQLTLGYEVLLRGTHPGLSPVPGDLFPLAEQCRLAGELSRLIRTAGAVDARQLPARTTVFFNLHPVEMVDAGLIDSLGETQSLLQEGQAMVAEVSEAAVTNLPAMRAMAQQLGQAGIGFAYDDFGAGQARLMELVEVPPEYLKLDIGLIRDLNIAATRRELVRAILGVAGDLGIQVIAEGVETTPVAETCREMGIDWGQGYLFGRPLPVTAISGK